MIRKSLHRPENIVNLKKKIRVGMIFLFCFCGTHVKGRRNSIALLEQAFTREIRSPSRVDEMPLITGAQPPIVFHCQHFLS